MKRAIIFLVVMVLSQSALLKAQSEEKCLKEGTMIVDVYYGFPNLYSSTLKRIYSSYSGISVSSFGPVGGKFEYLVTEKFGIGLDCNYSTLKLTFTDTYRNSAGNLTTYHETISSPALRAMVGFNFHFVNTKAVDVYGAIKGGYYNRTFVFTSDYPGATASYTIPNLIPIAMRLEMGMRYFFTPNFGAHVNLGFGGGPLVGAGLSAKF